MRNIQSSLNEDQYQIFAKQCKRLGESEYQYVKKAVFERMIRNGGVIARIQEWLLTDHPILPKKR